jgi:tetratricopeptide (TPR) repeat protein
VVSENREQFQIAYQAGKAAFESGQYRAAVQHFQAASALIPSNSRLGGEVQMWLAIAYEAAGDRTEAIALYQQLQHHPDLETRKQGKRLLYIAQAPELSRRSEWLVEIPDLKNLPESESKFDRGVSNRPAGNRAPRPRSTPEAIDLSQVNTKDNLFIWFGLIVTVLILGGLIWFGRSGG